MTIDETKFQHAAGTSLAAFTLAQICLVGLVKSGFFPKSEAERTLREGVAANRSGGPENQIAAQMLETVLRQVSTFQTPTRQ